MSQELAAELGFKIGEKVLYPNYIPYVVFMQILTVKDVRSLGGNGEVVMDVEEVDGYINPLSVYTKEQIIEMFED